MRIIKKLLKDWIISFYDFTCLFFYIRTVSNLYLTDQSYSIVMIVKVKYFMIIGLVLAFLVIGSVSASQDGDILEDNATDPDLSEDISVGDTVNDTKKDVEYTFDVDFGSDYLIGSQNSLIVSLPPLENNSVITLDSDDNVLYSFHPTGVGMMLGVGDWNLTPGKHVLKLTYPGDREYNGFSTSINFTASFIKVYIGDEIVYPDLRFNFAYDATGKVQIFVDDDFVMNKTVKEFRDGVVEIFPRYEPYEVFYVPLENLSYGKHTYRILYSDDEKYSLDNPITGQFNLTYEFDVVATNTDGIYYYGDPAEFGIIVSDDVEKVIVEYNGKNITVIPGSDDFYDAVVVIDDLKVGENNITFTSINGNYRPRTIVECINVRPGENMTSPEPMIAAGNLKVVYSDASRYRAVIYEGDNPASDVPVSFYINGRFFKNVTCDENGLAEVKITQKPGNYEITTKALNTSATYNLTVKHALKLKKVKVKKSAKKLVIKVNCFKNKKITLKFNGKKYTAKTNKKGVAKVTIKSKDLKKLKVGKKVTYQATYLKDTVKNSVKVKK